VTATKKNIPGKRIKTLHRAARALGVRDSLRGFARALLTMPTVDGKPNFDTRCAHEWLTGKGVKVAPLDVAA
jgi:hypothetical protein